jgi:hypothetical protein
MVESESRSYVVLNEILNAFFVFQESIKVEPHLFFSLFFFFCTGPFICVLMTELLSHTFTSFQVSTAVSAHFVVHWISFQTLISTRKTARVSQLGRSQIEVHYSSRVLIYLKSVIIWLCQRLKMLLHPFENLYVGFEVLTAMVTNSIFWYITPCSPHNWATLFPGFKYGDLALQVRGVSNLRQ